MNEESDANSLGATRKGSRGGDREMLMTLNKKEKYCNMGDLNGKRGVKADKKMERRHADKPPLGLVSERRGGRGAEQARQM